jgi:hypothetical protein
MQLPPTPIIGWIVLGTFALLGLASAIASHLVAGRNPPASDRGFLRLAVLLGTPAMVFIVIEGTLIRQPTARLVLIVASSALCTTIIVQWLRWLLSTLSRD